MTIQEYFGDWCKVIDLKEADRLIKQLSMLPYPDNSNIPPVCPLPKDIFKAFRLCPLHNTKVILLGQDPYPTLRLAAHGSSMKLPTATGLAFANISTTPQNHYSPSLEVLRDSVIDFTVPHGTINFDPSLEKWEEQGVLLLNAALSCLTGKPGSHTLMWRPFMKTLLTNLSASEAGLIYVLMGTVAQSFEAYINPKTNHIIRIRHPAHYVRTKTSMPSDIWSDINHLLIAKYGNGIQWFQEE